MPHNRQFEWTSDAVEAFWDFESAFPERYFTHANADGMIKRLQPYFDQAESILDYGCGTGVFLARLAERGYRVAGTDTSQRSLEVVRRRLHKYHNFLGALPPDRLLAQGHRFDMILASELVEHLQDEWLDYVLDMHRRLLKPDGRIVVTTPNQERLEDSLLMCPCCRSVSHRWQHVRSWSPASLTDYLERREFRVIEAFATDFSELETPQERWNKLSRWKRFKKTLKGRTPEPEPQALEKPHLVVAFEPKQRDSTTTN